MNSKSFNTIMLCIAIAAGVAWLGPNWRQSSQPEADHDGPPPALIVESPGDEAILQYLRHQCWEMSEMEAKFAQRVQAGEFAGNGKAAAAEHKRLADQVRETCQTAILQRVNQLQSDRDKVAEYATQASQGWKAAYRRISQ